MYNCTLLIEYIFLPQRTKFCLIENTWLRLLSIIHPPSSKQYDKNRKLLIK